MTHRLSLDQIARAAASIDPIFLHSPQFVSEPLSDELGVRVALKIETLNPIRSFKGRGADWLVSQVSENDHILCASAGNFGQAMAYACRKRGIRLTIYASTQANPLKLERMRRLGAEVILHGMDFDAAKQEARRVAILRGARFIEDSLDIETLEGAATMGLELLVFPEPLDTLLVALGNGAMFNGVARVIKAYQSNTSMVAVQAVGAPAMIESWRSGSVVTHDQMDTIADGIGVRVPVPETLTDMQGLVDDALLVPDESILQAMRLLHRHLGLVVEPSGAVGIAALLETPEMFRGQLVGTIICGGNLTVEQMQAWL
jgi:threonine dehydratase